MEQIISDAAPEMAKAFVTAATKARDSKDGVGSVSLHVEKHGFTVAIKRIDEDTSHDRYLGRGLFNVMTRADLMAAERLGLETGRDLDRLITRQESAMGALFVPWQDLSAPFAGLALSTDQTFGEQDGWAPHMITKGRFRMSLWTVSKGWN